MDEKLVALIVKEVLRQLEAKKQEEKPESCAACEDIASAACKAIPLVKAQDPEALLRMKRKTTARIGVGKAGARLNTQTMLTLRADHAQARDAVFVDVDRQILDSLGLFTVQTCCEDKNTYVTRPDLGRKLNDEAIKTLKEKCIMNPDVQIYAADGLSSTAIQVNLPKILPVLMDALKSKGLKVGTPFFLRFGLALRSMWQKPWGPRSYAC